ncbi:MAG: ABC transporter permease [Alphaproteobacteria bacterium]|nr:ABC transporter permease [Alphaproteobacteria bacterium]
MGAYVLHRLAATIPVMAVVALVVFSLLYLAPGDPAAVIAGDQATQAEIDAIRRKLMLDQPYHVRLGAWLASLLRGDLGVSIFSNIPVSTLIKQRLEPTIALTITTMIVAITLALPLGIIAAWRAGRWIDQFVMLFAVLGFSAPVFVVGYALIWLFAIELRWLPVQGYRSYAEGFVPFLRSVALPSLALGLTYTALIARITRASMIEELSKDYIRTARAKGVGEFRLLERHALKNAAIPITTIIGVGVALLIGGVVVTESVFAIPGLGRLTVDAILRRDYPVIQGVILVFAGVKVLINLIVDLLYVVFDPRIRY